MPAREAYFCTLSRAVEGANEADEAFIIALAPASCRPAER
jgi:hypothetical protein